MLMTHPPSLTGGEATVPPCRLDKLAFVTGVSRRVQCDGAWTPRKKVSPRVVRLRPMDATAGKLLMGPWWAGMYMKVQRVRSSVNEYAASVTVRSWILHPSRSDRPSLWGACLSDYICFFVKVVGVTTERLL